MGTKMAQKWQKNGKLPQISFLRHFLGDLFPSSGRGHFLFLFGQVFPIFGFRSVFHSAPDGLSCKSNPVSFHMSCGHGSTHDVVLLRSSWLVTAYGMKVGVRTPYNRGSYAIKVHKSPFLFHQGKGLLRDTTLILWHIFGACFLLIWGGGLSELFSSLAWICWAHSL